MPLRKPKEIEYMDWKEFHKSVLNIGATIKADIEVGRIKVNSVYGIPRGGLIPAVWLSHYLGVELILDKKKIKKHTLIVDDISDTGKTLSKFKNNITASLYITQHTNFEPDYWALVRNSNWIVFPWEVD